MNITKIITMCCGLVLLAGCDRPINKQSSDEQPKLPVFVSEPITGTPTPIPQIRKQAQPGDEVILSGLIMGVMHPFVEGRAVFVLGDKGTITPCDDMPTDHCSTPWDACCDPQEIRANGTATIQVLNETGKPAHIGLKGIHGLSELSKVTVKGVVAPNSTPEAFIVNASAIHIGVR